MDEVKALIADHSHAATFFCGGCRNADRFIDLLDAVFVLDVDLATLQRRVAGRGDDEFGGKPEEWALLAQLHTTREGLPQQGVIVDSGRPVALVVDDILARIGAA